MKNINFKNIFLRSLPWIIIIFASIFSAYTLLFNGITSGDDRVFHLAQIEDLYLSFKKGYWRLSTNHTFFGIFALDNYGYYGPFPHYAAAVIQFIFSGAGANSIGAYKTMIMLTTIVSGIFAYLFSMQISKKNVVLSVICTVFYIFLPYRVFCGICRQAYSETIALSFIPMVFYAAYRIINDDRYYVAPYVCLIVGAVLIILSHPFTALMSAIFGGIYIIINLYKIIIYKRWKHVSLNLAISALIIGISVMFYVSLALHTQGMNIFRLSDSVAMWTNFDHVSQSTLTSATFSGFLNWYWIFGTPYTASKVSLLLFGLFLYFICFALMYVVDCFIKKCPNNKYYRYIVDFVVLFLIPAIFWQRGEFYFALLIGYICFVLICLFRSKKKDKDVSITKDKLYKNPDIYFCCFGIIINLIFIFIGDAWKFVPSVFYSAQFAWRLFGFLYFFLFYLALIVINELKQYKYTYAISGVIASFFILLSMPIFEKREAYENDIGLYQVADEDWLKTIYYSGAQNEMVPQVFYQDGYVPAENSLYNNIFNRVRSYSRFIYTMEEYINPAFISGNGELTITELNTPNVTFSANVTSDTALVQLPQFYQDGYFAYFNDEVVSGTNVDGLVSFELPKGEYTLNVKFERTKTFRILEPFFYVGMGSVVVFGIGGYIYRKKFSHEEELTNN